MWFIGVEVEQETSALPPEKNPGSDPVQTCSSQTVGIENIPFPLGSTERN